MALMKVLPALQVHDRVTSNNFVLLSLYIIMDSGQGSSATMVHQMTVLTSNHSAYE